MSSPTPPASEWRASVRAWPWRRVLSIGLDLGMLATASAVVVRLLGLESGHPWTALMAGFPYLAPITAAGVAASVAIGNRRSTSGFVVVHLVVLSILLPQVVAGPRPSTPPDGPTITVLGANLLHGDASADRVVELVDRYDVDVVALSELTPDAVTRLREAGLDARLPHAHLADRRGTVGSGLYAAVPLAPRPDVAPDAPATMVRAAVDVAGARPIEVTAVHPWPPVTDGHAAEWEASLDALPPTDLDVVRVLVGDFNGTADHAAFRRVVQRGYVDAGDATGKGLLPTWSRPGGWPPLPPVTIDHVLVDHRVEVLEFWVEELPGSDHDVVIARLRLPAP